MGEKAPTLLLQITVGHQNSGSTLHLQEGTKVRSLTISNTKFAKIQECTLQQILKLQRQKSAFGFRSSFIVNVVSICIALIYLVSNVVMCNEMFCCHMDFRFSGISYFMLIVHVYWRRRIAGFLVKCFCGIPSLKMFCGINLENMKFRATQDKTLCNKTLKMVNFAQHNYGIVKFA